MSSRPRIAKSAGRRSADSLVGILFGAALSIASARADERARDPWLWPFSGDSIWNTPIGSEAVYVPANIRPAQNAGIDEELLFRVSEGAPHQKLFAPKSWEQRAGGTKELPGFQIDDAVVVPDARKWWTPNACAALLMPDGWTVKNIGVLCRPVAGGPVYGYNFGDTDLRGDGIRGSHGASAMSALGGSIRVGEFTGPEPIRHSIKIDLFCKLYAYYGPDRKGFRWPADRADNYAAKEYGGKNPALVMGSLLAIPPNVTEQSVALKTPVGRKLFRVLQDFGAYLVDDSAWDCHYLCAEKGVEEELKEKLGLRFDDKNGPLFADVNALFTQLAIVDNNAPDRVGGGGTPRAPLAPPLAQNATPAPRHEKIAPRPSEPGRDFAKTGEGSFKLTILNGGMTQGFDVPANWSDKFGNVEAKRDTQTFKLGPAALRVSVAGGKSGMAFQKIQSGAGARVTIAGAIKSRGKVKAQACVQAFAEGFKNNQFMQLQFVQGDTDWTEFSKEITLPEWTANFSVGILVEGEGEAWLDEVREAGAAVDPGKPQSEAARFTSEAPPKDKPWVPGWGFYPQYPQAWQTMLKEQLTRAKRGNINVVFIGDSITQGWGGDGKAVWEKRFAPLGAANFGIGGDSTRQVLWRIDHGLLDGLSPKVVVLKIGTNNLYDDFNAGTDEEIARGVETIVARLRQKLPSTRIVLCGILPRQNEFFTNRILKINATLKKFADGEMVRYLDLTDKFQTAPGKVIPELFVPDQLHLAGKGYEVWAEALEPVLRAMMK
jgi:lysophospholipase L1-like esterase